MYIEVEKEHTKLGTLSIRQKKRKRKHNCIQVTLHRYNIRFQLMYQHQACFPFFLFIYYFCVYMWEWMYHEACGGLRTACGSLFSPSTMQIPEIQLRFLALVTNTYTHRSIALSPTFLHVCVCVHVWCFSPLLSILLFETESLTACSVY